MIGILKLLATPVTWVLGKAHSRLGILNVAIIAAACAFAWLTVQEIRDLRSDNAALDVLLSESRAEVRRLKADEDARLAALRDELAAQEAAAERITQEVQDTVRFEGDEADPDVVDHMRGLLEELSR